uniref:Transmembrane protein n=1 Tax=Pithovirus LCPAC304 TaxID=2506594 RepID=A0A481Z9K0_9VIRU|nr:MAG: hypothetical protein LCPAC304_01690 [Pithovirus LCPAC304]
MYTDCVNEFIKFGTVPDFCQCNNNQEIEATIDIYLLNKTNETLTLVGSPNEALNWVTLGKHGKRCDGGFWQLPPPKSVPPNGAFMARAFSAKHTDGDDCCRDTHFYLCFTYLSSTSSDFVTIQVGRKREGGKKKPLEKCGKVCRSFNAIKNNSTHQGLKVETKVLDHSTIQFIVTDGKGPDGGCTFGPKDSCGEGLYCPGKGEKCMVGCKIDPLTHGSCDKTEICDPNTHVCVVPTQCTKNSGCPLNFICNTSESICVSGCVAGEDRCSAGRTCIQGQCQTGTGGNGGNGDSTNLKVILIIVVVIVAFIVILGGFIYVIYTYKNKK